MKPVSLTFCVAVEFLESSIALQFIPVVEWYEELSDAQVRLLRDSQCKESKETFNLNQLDGMVQHQLRTEMNN